MICQTPSARSAVAREARFFSELNLISHNIILCIMHRNNYIKRAFFHEIQLFLEYCNVPLKKLYCEKPLQMMGILVQVLVLYMADTIVFLSIEWKLSLDENGTNILMDRTDVDFPMQNEWVKITHFTDDLFEKCMICLLGYHPTIAKNCHPLFGIFFLSENTI